MSTPTSEPLSPVHVIGAGPGGLAVAAALKQRGIRAVVVDKAGDVGASWRGHYDRLHLHTTRRWSSLPGMPIPRSAGRWVARDDFVRYLERYAVHHQLDLAAGVEVSRVERDDSASPGGWTLLANGGRKLRASAVVLATGYNHTPFVPPWPGREGFTGAFLHAHAYRNPGPYAGKDVLVVGVGNTGAEIAADLAGKGGAGRVRLAVRTPPHILRRSTLGWPSQASGVLVRRLPAGLVDRMARPVARLLPDLARYGLPRPATGLYTRARAGAIPVQDVGLIRAVRKQKVRITRAVTAFDGDRVLLADGTAITPEVVIAATGYRRGLEPLIGHLGLLDGAGKPVVHGKETHPTAPGLYFTGFTNPISGMIRELARDAPRIAAAIARTRRG
ncbi:NAD(P)/FAD-dependent oxidoreductase [Streptomyces sp. XM4011]|uniref:flavin-containing monooxygenase n=1 Tax=Streptomyces TaxID=1883 RepID=UPI001FF895C8|nr:NAD(P)/FAD-dependent oxidoreductase [Streptomyces sp. XM4011]MCK1814928.1 NAD(P)/FAD-dependent oxidoreductase [Streptomyces sp. XM4011]